MFEEALERIESDDLFGDDDDLFEFVVELEFESNESQRSNAVDERVFIVEHVLLDEQADDEEDGGGLWL